MAKPKKKITPLFASIICGLACALCVFLYVSQVQNQADASRSETLAKYGGEQVDAVIATRDLQPGDVVDSSAVQVKLWVASLLPAESVSSTSEVIGKKVTSTILAGEPVSLKRFNDQSYSLSVPEGYTAISVEARDVQAVGGAISPGMYVDMYAVSGYDTVLLGSNLQVLATSQSAGDGTSSSMQWITVAMSPNQVEETVATTQKMEIYFTLPGQAVNNAQADSQTSTAATGGTASAKETQR